MVVVVLDRGLNTTCTINLHGATIVSWRVNNQEQLFVSRQAIFDGRKLIRGGISFGFPQYGSWSFGPQHGFARIIPWNVDKGPVLLPSGDVEVVFSLRESDYTRSMWNFEYCQITGLHGCTFIDKVRNNITDEEDREVVLIEEWTDRMYQNTPSEHIITNVISGGQLRILKYNLPDTVVWNPWIERAKDIKDFGDDEYPNMVCVEPGCISDRIVLLPGTGFEASVILQVM